MLCSGVPFPNLLSLRHRADPQTSPVQPNKIRIFQSSPQFHCPQSLKENIRLFSKTHKTSPPQTRTKNPCPWNCLLILNAEFFGLYFTATLQFQLSSDNYFNTKSSSQIWEGSENHHGRQSAPALQSTLAAEPHSSCVAQQAAANGLAQRREGLVNCLQPTCQVSIFLL